MFETRLAVNGGNCVDHESRQAQRKDKHDLEDNINTCDVRDTDEEDDKIEKDDERGVSN